MNDTKHVAGKECGIPPLGWRCIRAGNHAGPCAARYRWLKPRLLAADFDWEDTGQCVLVFKWPDTVAVGGNCDQNIDAAIAAATPPKDTQ